MEVANNYTQFNGGPKKFGGDDLDKFYKEKFKQFHLIHTPQPHTQYTYTHAHLHTRGCHNAAMAYVFARISIEQAE